MDTPPAPVAAAIGVVGGGVAVYGGYQIAAGEPLAALLPAVVGVVVCWSMWQGRRAGRFTAVGFAGLLLLFAVVYGTSGRLLLAAAIAAWAVVLALLVTVPTESRAWFAGGRLLI